MLQGGFAGGRAGLRVVKRKEKSADMREGRREGGRWSESLKRAKGWLADRMRLGGRKSGREGDRTQGGLWSKRVSGRGVNEGGWESLRTSRSVWWEREGGRVEECHAVYVRHLLTGATVRLLSFVVWRCSVLQAHRNYSTIMSSGAMVDCQLCSDAMDERLH